MQIELLEELIETLAVRNAELNDDPPKYEDEPKPRKPSNPDDFFLTIMTHRRTMELDPEVFSINRARNAGYWLKRWEHPLAKKLMELPHDSEFMKGFREGYHG